MKKREIMHVAPEPGPVVPDGVDHGPCSGWSDELTWDHPVPWSAFYLDEIRWELEKRQVVVLARLITYYLSPLQLRILSSSINREWIAMMLPRW
jgi:hypothetical protein